MTDLPIAITIGFLVLALINIAVQIKFSLEIGAHLKHGHDFRSFLTVRRLANRGLLLGCIACLIWVTIGWSTLSFLYLPLTLKLFIVVGIFVLLGMNLLIPLHFEERISPSLKN